MTGWKVKSLDAYKNMEIWAYMSILNFENMEKKIAYYKSWAFISH